MTKSGIDVLQKMNHQNTVNLSGVNYTVEIMLDGVTYLRCSEYKICEVYPLPGVSALYGIRSWAGDNLILNRYQRPVRFLLMGNLIEEVTEVEI